MHLIFYLNVVDDMLKHEQDKPTIGILICKKRNEIITEYALRGISNPIGVSEYQSIAKLPEHLKGCFPTIEEIQEQLSEPGKPKKPGD